MNKITYRLRCGGRLGDPFIMIKVRWKKTDKVSIEVHTFRALGY